MLWKRAKSNPPEPSTPQALIGVDLNASRLSATMAVNGQAKPIALTAAHPDLILMVNLETRQVGLGPIRKSPHLICSNFLSQLGLPHEWRGPRYTFTPESALRASFEALRQSLSRLGTQFALTLPSYLTPAQIKCVLDAASAAKLTLTTTSTSSLAIAAHRAESVLAPGRETPPREKPDWVVPMRPLPSGPGVAVIVDVDESCLFASAVQVNESEVRILASGHWPSCSLRFWRDRLLDAISDRCVRLCRRDPRDSGAAEQGLYDAIEDALDRSRRGQTVTLAARADRWYQDLTLTPADLESFSAEQTKQASRLLGEMLSSLALPVPPKAVWLSAKAAALPGLATALYEQSPEGTEVAVLPVEAAAEAAAALDARARSGQLSASHHDGVMPLHRVAEPPLIRSTAAAT